MMIHVPLCTSKNPENILIISDDADAFEKEIQKHDNINFKSIACGIEFLRDEDDESYDVIICEADMDKAVIAHTKRVLKEDGLLSMKHPSLDNTEANKNLMKMLAVYFKIIMPYNLGNCSTALLASKEYHPTADIILQRADMLDDLDYYNCDVHIASFAMGNYIRREYLGVIKN
jgi:spermidine synthase